MSKSVKPKPLAKPIKELSKNEPKPKKEPSELRPRRVTGTGDTAAATSSLKKVLTSKATNAPKRIENPSHDARTKAQKLSSGSVKTLTSKKSIEKESSGSVKTLTSKKSIEKESSGSVKTLTSKKSIEKDVKPNRAKAVVKPAKLISTSSKPVSQRDQKTVSSSTRAIPLKASHKIPLTNKPNAVSVSSKNVMNQMHNVTVSSPPPKRHEIITEQPEEVQRDRTRTRTLDKDEIVVLKPEDNPEHVKIRPSANQPSAPPVMQPAQTIDVEIKQPVSFEIKFDEKQKKEKETPTQETDSKRNEIQAGKSNQEDVPNDEDENEDYDDDFEDYESDFESFTESNRSSASSTETSDSSSSAEQELSEGEEKTASFHRAAVKLRVDEEQLDSGSFELKVLSSQNEAPPTESVNNLDEKNKSPEMQSDSGIDYNLTAPVQQTSIAANMNSLEGNNKTYDNISDIEAETTSLEVVNDTPKRPVISQRGRDLLSKITLDTMAYVLFDFKPIPYERFMRIYGKMNTTQISVQTHNNSIDQESQNDVVSMHTRWTQSPPSFFTNHIFDKSYSEYRIGCGKVTECDDDDQTPDYDIRALDTYVSRNDHIGLSTSSTDSNVDYESLNKFLYKNALTISTILNHPKRFKNLQKSNLPLNSGYFSIDCHSHSEFHSAEVYDIFASCSLPNFLFTLHRNEKAQLFLVGVWDLSDVAAPVCVLSTWSRIVCIEVHPNVKEVVIAGLEDSTIALWNIKESRYWHPKLCGKTKRLTPSQLVKSTLKDEEPQSQDIGRVVSIRSIYSSVDVDLLDGDNAKQIYSLHEVGILTIWTILTASTTAADISNKRIDHQSFWSNVKLTQSKLVDLRPTYIEKTIHNRPTSAFEKNRSYFERELFSDAVLQELQATTTADNAKLSRFACSALEVTEKGVFVATNKNFLIFGRRSLKANTIRKILVNVASMSPVSFLTSLEGYEDNVMLVGLENGLIIPFCVETEIKRLEASNDADADGRSLSSASSLPPVAASSTATVGVSYSVDPGMFGVGKSCAIQNIVQSERELYDESQAVSNLDLNEFKLLTSSANTNNPPRLAKLTNFLNDQPIIISSLEHFQSFTAPRCSHLNKSNKIITLQRSKLKIYDITSNKEVDVDRSHKNKYYGITSTCGDNDVEYLVFLKNNNIIDCHLISSAVGV